MTPTIRRALAAAAGGLLLALNRKLKLDLDAVAIGGITTIVVAYVSQSVVRQLKE